MVTRYMVNATTRRNPPAQSYFSTLLALEQCLPCELKHMLVTRSGPLIAAGITLIRSTEAYSAFDFQISHRLAPLLLAQGLHLDE